MTQAVNCPSCNHQISIDDSPQQTELEQLKVQMNQPKKISHEELSQTMPKGVNFMSCPGGDCGHAKLENQHKTTKFYDCPHCDSNTVPNNSELCPTCGKNLEDEDLSESNVDISEDKGFW